MLVLGKLSEQQKLLVSILKCTDATTTTATTTNNYNYNYDYDYDYS